MVQNRCCLDISEVTPPKRTEYVLQRFTCRSAVDQRRKLAITRRGRQSRRQRLPQPSQFVPGVLLIEFGVPK